MKIETRNYTLSVNKSGAHLTKHNGYTYVDFLVCILFQLKPKFKITEKKKHVPHWNYFGWLWVYTG